MSAIAIGKTKFFHKLILPSRTVYYNKVSKTAFPHFHVIIIPHSNKSRDAKSCVSQATPYHNITQQTIDCQLIKPYGRRKILRLYRQLHTKLSHTKLLTVNTQTKRETQNLAYLQATPYQTVTLQTIDCQLINHTGDAKSCVSTSIPTQYYNATHIDNQRIKTL